MYLKNPKPECTGIMKIRNTVHTAGIDSFSMYEHLHSPPMVSQSKTQRQDFKAFRIFTYTSSGQNLVTQANLEKLDDVKMYHRYLDLDM